MKVTDLEQDPETEWVADILQIAKKNLVKSGGSLEPCLFVRAGDGKYVVCPLTQLGDINDDDDKDIIAAGARHACKVLAGTACAFLSDTWITSADNEADAKALDEAGKYADLPEEVQKRVRRREAIVLAIETRGRPALMLSQFYKRGPALGEITFEEAMVSDGVGESRFTGLLPDEPPPLETWTSAIGDMISLMDEDTRDIDGFKRIVGVMAKVGYTWRITDDAIYICRRDGTCVVSLPREKNEEKWEALRDACLQLDASRQQQATP